MIFFKSILFLLISPVILAKSLYYIPGSSVYLGKLTSNKECRSKENQIFFVHENIVIYQIPVPTNGDFVAHLVPKEYQLIGINDKGCFFEKKLNAKSNVHFNETVQLEKIDPKKQSSLLDFLIKQTFATSLCVHCLHGQYAPGRPGYGGYFGGYPTMRFGYPTPYWGPFGHYSFNQFSSPCPMGYTAGFNGGCQRYSYPGEGRMVAGKPVVYFYANKSKNIKLNIELEKIDSNNILASSPIISNEGIEFQIGTSGGLDVGQTHYSSLFYDIRTNYTNFQQNAGHCTSSEKAIKAMVLYLQEAGFQKHEIEDFSQYWNIKIPKYNKMCIFPQSEQQLEKTIKLTISPRPSKFTRILFVLVPIVNNQYPKYYFKKDPSINWSYKTKVSTNKSGPIIREWGIAFLTVPEPSKDVAKNSFKSIVF